MGLRVWEDGESESCMVIMRIGVERSGNITPHESGQTSIRCLVTREFEKPTEEIRQMTAKAGAISHGAMNWHAIEWEQVHCEVRRLQARIVKVTQDLLGNRVLLCKAFEMLEPCAGKLASTVLRGEGD